MKSIIGAFPGTVVSTTYGPAQIKQIRGDGVHIAIPVNWKLADYSSTQPTLYLNPACKGDKERKMALTYTKGFNEGDEVMTLEGQGYVESKRQSDLVIKLRNHLRLDHSILAPAACIKIPGLAIGAAAKTVWGMVRVLNIQRDGTHVCEALHWVMADGKPPKFYLAPEAFAMMSLKPDWNEPNKETCC